MRKAIVFFKEQLAGTLTEVEFGKKYEFEYFEDYDDNGISLTMPTSIRKYTFDSFPPFFDGLLPEGFQLEGLLKTSKIDKNDCFSQLMATGEDLPGAITAKETEA
jgi:serine/threonine-protein kinase HipA